MRRSRAVLAGGWMCAAVWVGNGWGQGAGAKEEARGEWMGVVAAATGKLKSEDYAEREAGQAMLKKIPPGAVAELRKMAEAAADREVGGRLARRADELEEEVATHPAAISVDLKEATFGQTAAALRRAIGIDFDSGMGVGKTLYTLKMEQVSFWEVIAKLNEMGEVSLNGKGEFGLVNSPGRMPNFQAQGVLATYGTVGMQGANEGSLILRCTLAADPRVRVLGYTAVQWDKIVDEKGNALMVAPETMDRGAMVIGLNAPTWTDTTVLVRPAAMGAKIRSARGRMRVEIGVGEIGVDLGDGEKLVNKPVKVGVGLLEVLRFERAEGQVTVSAHLTGEGQMIAPPAALLIVGSDGTPLGVVDVPAVRATVFRLPEREKGPLRVVASSVRTVKEMEVGIELKDWAVGR